MVNKDKGPATYENSENPWLKDYKNDKDVIEINGQKITARYLWTLNSEERIKCLEDVFNYYREKGFPYERYDNEYIKAQFEKLVKYDSRDVIVGDHIISNSGMVCLDVCRHFSWDKFWKASNDTMQSIEDVFNDDDMLKDVLKNRMGWNYTTEGAAEGEYRPYMFAISDTQLLTGIRNSAAGYGVSNFRPGIAKYFYEKYLGHLEQATVFDYSGGWGARALAAASLGYDYYCTDPLTAPNINELGEFLHKECGVTSVVKAIQSGSEIADAYKDIPKVDMCLSCPPYFKLEVYSDDTTQSYNEYNEFEDWIEHYWKATVENCLSILKEHGYFVLIIKDNFRKYSLKDSMERVLLDHGFAMVDSYQYKTLTNHLSNKVKTRRVDKNSEYCLIYKLL